MDIKAFWRAVLAQDEPEIRTAFCLTGENR